MRYDVSYNQVGLIEYNLNNPLNKIDFIDAILLRELNILSNAKGMNTKVFNNDTFVWASYKKLIDDLPTIGIDTKDGLAKRLKNRLIKNRLIEFKVDIKDNSKTYFRLTAIGLQTDSYRMTDRNPIGLQTEPLSDESQTNKYINNNINKDKREGTHFDFLNSNYIKEIESIKVEYKLPVKEWSNCIIGFNDLELNKPTVNRFEKYVRNWKKILNKNNENTFNENTLTFLSGLKRIG